MKPQLTIIILSYNVSGLLHNCLQSIFLDPESKHWQIIVVDNASADNTVKLLNKSYKNKIQLIASKSNLGFSTGNNLATKHIEANYTLFLNPDTVVPIGTIPHMLQYIKVHPKIGAATCKIILSNGKIDDSCHRGFPTPWSSLCYFSGLTKLFPQLKLFTGYNLSHLDLNTIHEIDSLTGAFMMIPTKLGQQLNWWDEDYFFNAEDIDFCYRIKQAGYKVIYIPDVTITHYKGSSGGYKSTSYGSNTVSKEVKIKTAKESTRAMRLFYQKHYANKYPRWLTAITIIGINLLETYRLSKLK